MKTLLSLKQSEPRVKIMKQIDYILNNIYMMNNKEIVNKLIKIKKDIWWES